jgi:hypothetical protein
VNVVIVFVHFRFSFVQKRESQRASGGSELRESQQVSGLTGAVGRRQGEWRSLGVANILAPEKTPKKFREVGWERDRSLSRCLHHGSAHRRRANGRVVNTRGRQVGRCVIAFPFFLSGGRFS